MASPVVREPGADVPSDPSIMSTSPWTDEESRKNRVLLLSVPRSASNLLETMLSKQPRDISGYINLYWSMPWFESLNHGTYDDIPETIREERSKQLQENYEKLLNIINTSEKNVSKPRHRVSYSLTSTTGPQNLPQGARYSSSRPQGNVSAMPPCHRQRHHRQCRPIIRRKDSRCRSTGETHHALHLPGLLLPQIPAHLHNPAPSTHVPVPSTSHAQRH